MTFLQLLLTYYNHCIIFMQILYLFSDMNLDKFGVAGEAGGKDPPVSEQKVGMAFFGEWVSYLPCIDSKRFPSNICSEVYKQYLMFHVVRVCVCVCEPPYYVIVTTYSMCVVCVCVCKTCS